MADFTAARLFAVTFIDSSGLELIVEHVFRAWDDGDRLRIRTSAHVATRLDRAGLSEPFARVMLDELPDTG